MAKLEAQQHEVMSLVSLHQKLFEEGNEAPVSSELSDWAVKGSRSSNFSHRTSAMVHEEQDNVVSCALKKGLLKKYKRSETGQSLSSDSASKLNRSASHISNISGVFAGGSASLTSLF